MVVAGNPDHPEMIGVVGYAPNNTYVVRDASEVASLPPLRSPLVVSQTTIKLQTFLEVAEAVREKADTEPQVVNTICSATRDRQDAARALAGQVDAFYVIGGRHSSNSVKLLAVCQEQCAKSFLIETPAEINPADLKNVKKVGVTAGASTPNWLIDQVVERLHADSGAVADLQSHLPDRARSRVWRASSDPYSTTCRRSAARAVSASTGSFSKLASTEIGQRASASFASSRTITSSERASSQISLGGKREVSASARVSMRR